METFGFISLGLIGGSVARAIREKNPDAKIIAYNRSPRSLEEALSDGVINEAVYQSDFEKDGFRAFAGCDLIFLCAPVQKNEEFLEQLKPVISPSCIITDVGSVKQIPAAFAKNAGLSSFFVGGHPMAGSEKSGYDNSSEDLLKGCVYILTPTDDTDTKKTERISGILKALGFELKVTTPYLHDYAVAGISHLPHVSSAALTCAVKDADTDDHLMKAFAGNGFQDTTRIAASSPEVWEQICLANSENIVELLERYIEKLELMKHFISEGEGEGIRKMFKDAGNYLHSGKE